LPWDEKGDCPDLRVNENGTVPFAREKELRMSPVEWYYARNNKQMGPVSSLELKRLAAAGALGPDDLVWHEGLTEWASARIVRGLFEEEGRGAAAAVADQPPLKAGDSALKVNASAARPKETPPAAPARHLFDVLLDKYRPHFNAHFVETTARVFRVCGSYGLFVAAAVTAAFELIVATKQAPLEHVLWGVIWVLALLALHYVAGKSCDAVEELNRTTGGRLSSTLLPNCLAVLSKVLGVAILLASVATAVATSQYPLILLGMAAFLVCAYLTVVALNPATLNISIAAESLPGEEAIGAVMFLLKALLRLAPVAFGAGVVAGTAVMGFACCLAFAGDPRAGDMMLLNAQLTADRGLHALLSSAALPLAAYLVFLLGNLVLNLWRSVLSLPVKLDKLAAKGEAEEKRA
jgi:hypothetical protein